MEWNETENQKVPGCGKRHTVVTGREKAFEKGAIETMEALSDATGFLGYMILGVMAHLMRGTIHHVFSTDDGRTWLEVLFGMMKSRNPLT
ncbi:MAG: sulfur oxygenase reductase family protein [Desulfobulbaceae bacterium]